VLIAGMQVHLGVEDLSEPVEFLAAHVFC